MINLPLLFRPIPITNYANTTVVGNIFQEPANNNYAFEKFSVKVRCNNCSNEQFTRVERKVSSNGMAWAILCCFCGSWILSLLVLCVDGFREFLHYCSSCNSLLGIHKPTFSRGLICLLVLLTVFIIGLQVAIFIFIILPVLSGNGSDGYYGYWSNGH